MPPNQDTMLIIETPPSRETERDYTFDVLLGEFLGLDWQHKTTDRKDVKMTLAGDNKNSLSLPDAIFSSSKEFWLTAQSLPNPKLPTWDSRNLSTAIPLTDPILPVIYGTPHKEIKQESQGLQLPIDIFGSAFFMLSRYEELITEDRDKHERFPATASLAYKAEFLERPIVDEYVEILWAAISRLWPRLNRKKRTFNIRVSHDVDRPTRYQFTPSRRFLLSLTADVVKRRKWLAPLKAALTKLSRFDRLHPSDPYNTFDWIMDVSEKHAIKSAFYFICGRTKPELDASYEPDHPAILDLMKRIHERGHEIGLHPSYNSFNNPDAIKQEADRLRMICAKIGIHQPVFGGRMHYLRWDQAITPFGWENACMDYDSTLGYADYAGFRCGTCHEYPAFDLTRRTKLRLRLRPLIAMEGSVFDRQYMGLSNSKAISHLNKLRTRTAIFNGSFTLLWHNSELNDKVRLKQYELLLKNTSSS